MKQQFYKLEYLVKLYYTLGIFLKTACCGLFTICN